MNEIEELNRINEESRRFQAERADWESVSRSKAQTRKDNRLKRISQISWTVCAWAAVFCAAVVVAHSHSLPLDMILSILGGGSLVAGIIAGRLIGKLGE